MYMSCASISDTLMCLTIHIDRYIVSSDTLKTPLKPEAKEDYKIHVLMNI